MNPIVGIGELLWDIFPDGHKVAGGAPFNFAFHCKQLGHEAVIVSRVGDDELGRELRAEVRRLGLTDDFIQIDDEHPTGTVRVTVDDKGQPSYEIVEEVAWDYIEWNDALSRLASQAVALCYGMIGQRRAESSCAIHEFIQRTTGLRVFDVNLRPGSSDLWQSVRSLARQCDWFKASDDDIEGLFDRVAGCMTIDSEPRSPLCYFFDPDMDQRKLGILTLGPKGCQVIDWQHGYRERGVEANVVDTVGAGDSFLAAFLCSHLEGRSLKTTMRFALHYSARVCEFAGATPLIDRDEVEIALLDDPWMRRR